MTTRTRLLVSVRNRIEALAALAGGADLIDVKEPARGPLGRADDVVIAAVVRSVAGRRPVSAALGELRAETRLAAPPGLRYRKWGLAGSGADPTWQETLITSSEVATHVPLSNDVCHLVPVAYADWRCAAAPSLEQVCAFVRRYGSVVLIDTFDKTAGATLLDYLTVREISELCAWCHAAGIEVALAGSLSASHMKMLKGAGPDWFGVRGAACQGGRRDAAISRQKVRELAELVHA